MASSVPPEPATWYDAEEILVSLRPSARQSAAQEAGVQSANDLPLYDVTLRLSEKREAFDVTEVLHFTNTEKHPLAELELRIYANVPPLVTGAALPVTFVGGSCDEVPCHFHSKGEALTVRPRAPLAPRGRLRIRMRFRGRVEPSKSEGTNDVLSQLLGRGDAHAGYGLLAAHKGVVTLANFYAVLAPRVDGRWRRDKPSAIGDLTSDATSHVRAVVEAPASHRVLANGTTTEDSVLLNGYGPGGHVRRVSVNAAFVRDFVVLLGPWSSTEQSVGNVIVASHFLPADRRAGEHALDVASRALRIFENRFGSYPYRRLDVVQAPLQGGAGGMEFSGLVLLADSLYGAPQGLDLGGLASLMPPAARDRLRQVLHGMREFVTVHEVAHQWWHVLVGTDSRISPFADEALTQFSTLLYYEDRYGKPRAEREARMNLQLGYQFMRMSGDADGPASRPAAEFPSSRAYGGLVYGKAPFLYRDIRSLVGDSAFFAGLRTYVDRYRFRLAPGRALFDIWAQGTRKAEVENLVRRWLDEAHGDEDMGGASVTDLLQNILGSGDAAPKLPSFDIEGVLGRKRGLQDVLRGM